MIEELLFALSRAAESGGISDIFTARRGLRSKMRRVRLTRSRAVRGLHLRKRRRSRSRSSSRSSRLIRERVKDPATLASETWEATVLLDALGLYTTEVYQKSARGHQRGSSRRCSSCRRRSSTLWDGVLALPLIGTLDSARTQVVMESLLQRIVETGAAIAILDITGVPTVDTLVAQHLLKTVAAARLMGADCIISGIRPQIAQTIVHLGVDLDCGHHEGDAGRCVRRRAQAHRPGGRTLAAPPATPAAIDAARPRANDVERIPILKMGEFLLVSIQVDMHDRLAHAAAGRPDRRGSPRPARAAC